MVKRHYKLLQIIALAFPLLLLPGCDNTTKTEITVKPHATEKGKWEIKVDITVEAQDRADALARVTQVLDALSKSSVMPPVPAEKPPEKK